MKPLKKFSTAVITAAWINLFFQACQGDLPQELVLDWLKKRILEGLHLDKPPVSTIHSPSGQKVHVAAQHEARRVRREVQLEISQIILFPSSGQSIYVFISNPNIYLSLCLKKIMHHFCVVCYHA